VEKGGLTPAEVAWRTASAPPYRLQPLFEGTRFASFQALWAATLDSVEADCLAELSRLRSEGAFTELQYLTNTGYFYHGLEISPDGKRLIFTRDRPLRENAVFGLDLEGDAREEPQELFARSTGYQSSFSASGRFIAYDQTLRSLRHYLMSDIHLYDLKRKRIVSVSPYLRARDPDIHPDGKHLAFVVNERGKNRLLVTDSAWGDVRTIYAPSGYERLSAPRFSPDGSQIVFTSHNGETGGEDVLIAGPEGVRVLLADGRQNLFPSWTPDGGRILFSSDRNGVFNVFAYDLRQRRLFRVSHVAGGVFYPVVDPQANWIYVASIRSRGFDVARFRWDPEAWRPEEVAAPREVEPQGGPRGEGPGAPVPVVTSEYRGSKYLLPQYLRPSLLIQPHSVQVGFNVGATDPLFFQNYELDLRYDGATGRPVGRLFYFNGTRDLAWDWLLVHEVNPAATSLVGVSTLSSALSLNVPLSRDGTHFHLRPGLLFQSVYASGPAHYLGPHLAVRYDTRFKDLGQSFYGYGSLIDLDLRHLIAPAEGWPGTLSLTASLERHLPLRGEQHALHLSLNGAAFLAGYAGPSGYFSVGGQESFPYDIPSKYSVYSYPSDYFRVSSRLILGDALYTFPLIDIQRGHGTFPLVLGRLSAGFRVQAGWTEAETGGVAPWSTGAELYQDLLAGHVFAFTAKGGIYYGASAQGRGWNALFTISGAEF
jgi:hypothetical protein